MTRRRADLQPSPRERLWQTMRERKECTLLQLVCSTGVEKRTVQSYLQGLVKAGFIEHRVLDREGYYRLTREQAEAPRVDRDGKLVTQGAGREALWRTMKILREFTCRELVAHASTERHRVAEDEALTYVRFLKLAGYLKLMQAERRGRSPRQARYAFVPARNTGPRPPMIQRIKQVYDPNLGRVVWAQEVGNG